jgi:HSP20 family protein
MALNEPMHSVAPQDDACYGRVLRPSGGYDLYLVRMRHAWRPPTDVYETERNVVIRVEVAGMAERDFTILVKDRRLVISGIRSDPAEKLSYQNMEIHYGEFRTEVLLSWAVAQEAIEATYHQGFLSVSIPKAEERRIQVRVSHVEE